MTIWRSELGERNKIRHRATTLFIPVNIKKHESFLSRIISRPHDNLFTPLALSVVLIGIDTIGAGAVYSGSCTNHSCWSHHTYIDSCKWGGDVRGAKVEHPKTRGASESYTR
ncbi:uncharacterized protein EV420DRAFT_1486809 [Desarmillaria tabescens]|uniref:Uncharacterized protein n=1 Tax=Armillaria tabescens TaxID=1929756 RepID=A0AA39MLJ6_ARMTA|nr:uncharacterized protein EV420DRAFT_1486809 [Desarmillaria tabescens]KAK0438154.1 hypothetical protein EV420DRAFT_1486809 [Desarmillaria tabescens]